MIKDIITVDEDVAGILRKKADPVTKEEFTLVQSDIDDMVDTMYASNGLGLAANQIGLEKRIFVLLGPKNEAIVAINPEYIVRSTKKIKSYGEGCLSCKNAGRRDIRRHRYVKVKALDRNGDPFLINTTNKTTNIAIQHEMDHLNGVLIIDK
jgi:peptide deformylase